MVKKLMHAVGIFTLVVTLAFCAFSSDAAGEKDTLIIGMQDDSVSLDPAVHIQTVSAGFINQMYEKLVSFRGDDFTEPVADLASSWELSEDGKSWTFSLRKDAVFASGNPVTADDVVFSFHRVIRLNGELSWILKQFGITEESITKSDDHTVQIVLNQQYAPGVFFACLGHAVASILDQKVVMEHEQNGDMGSAWLQNHSAGSGRFVLEERTQGEIAILNANPYYQKDTANIQKVIVKNIPDPFEQALMLEKGEINLAWDLQPTQIKRLETNLDIQLYQTPILRLNFINMSLGYPPLEKPEVRKAIRFAIDYDTIVDYILEGEAIKIQTIIPKGILGHNPAMPYSPDINKAKQLLADAGYPDGFEVELMCLNYTPWTDIAFQIKKDLAQIGISVTVAQKEVPQMLEKVMSRDFQMFLWEWEFDYPDPDAMAKPFAHSDSLGDDATIKLVAWVCKYVNVETSKLVEQAAQELDNEKRKQLYQQITETMLYDGPTAILYSPIKQYGISSENMNWIGIPSFVFGGFPMLK